MADDPWKVGVFYLADNGNWYEIKKVRLLDRLDSNPEFENVLNKGNGSFPNKPFLLMSNGTAKGDDDFNLGDGVDGS
jgi:hypothetical protein